MSESVHMDGTLIQWGACAGCAQSIPLAPPVINARGEAMCFRCQDGDRAAAKAVDWLAMRLRQIRVEAANIEAQLQDYQPQSEVEGS